MLIYIRKYTYYKQREYYMDTKQKKAYVKPEFKNHGSFAQITQMGGGQGIDGIIGIDLDGDGNVDIGTGVTTGSM